MHMNTGGVEEERWLPRTAQPVGVSVSGVERGEGDIRIRVQ